MFGKLCKYEFKSIGRTLVPIYLAIIAISILNAFMGLGSLANGYYNGLMSGLSFGRGLLSLIQTLSIIAYFGVLVAMSVLTLIVVIQRFYKGLLCDEGYLMFTLPVKPWQLIAAKGVVAFVMSLASSLVAFASVFILVLGTAGTAKVFTAITDPQLWNAISRAIAHVSSWPLLVFEVIVLIIVSGLVQLYHMYFSMALGHLASKNRVMMSVIAFIAISMLFSFINGLAMIILGNVPSFQSFFRMIETMPDTQGISLVIHLTFIGSVIYNAIQLAIFFFGTERILSKRLNLE
ncbi:hypothetical protein [Lacrimispora sphenoides]|uniref:ABC transporter permease n=1 Tax=Lacrimispora sphenoides JCM 1415 TaxID=1297793 RepID=A0ABY1CCM9_9FIRM|nr:hypothetical protein [Lacrimispora sphenoides]SET92762.1 hypothetical protein SAMN02745906_3082 [[Clostridium] sphenoides JCM 1415]SUY52425.1 ABC transporter permease [Lacrimispora sphenoides]